MRKRTKRDQLFYYIVDFGTDESVTMENIISEVDALEDINNVFYDKDELTLLILATKRYQAEIVKLLLEKGADPNIGNNAGGRPLLYAIMRKDPQKPKIIELLLEYGANPALKSRGEQSIIEAAEVCLDFELADRFREIAKKFEEQ